MLEIMWCMCVEKEGHYEKCLDNYTDVDLVEDEKYDKRFD